MDISPLDNTLDNTETITAKTLPRWRLVCYDETKVDRKLRYFLQDLSPPHLCRDCHWKREDSIENLRKSGKLQTLSSELEPILPKRDKQLSGVYEDQRHSRLGPLQRHKMSVLHFMIESVPFISWAGTSLWVIHAKWKSIEITFYYFQFLPETKGLCWSHGRCRSRHVTCRHNL